MKYKPTVEETKAIKYKVIAIENNPQSVASAERCIRSAKSVGIEVEMVAAFTPKNNPLQHFKNNKLPLERFEKDAKQYSRFENVLSCFLSHWRLWRMAYRKNQTTCILEHDAFFFDTVPENISFQYCVTIGKPSYGKFNSPTKLGVGPLVHKRYFGGAHAYIVNPEGAKLLFDKAFTHAGPADVYLNLDNFPWLEEYYPWPVEARDTFTTIQKTEGCLAKHQYNENYAII